jgi:hypothetical protein
MQITRNKSQDPNNKIQIKEDKRSKIERLKKRNAKNTEGKIKINKTKKSAFNNNFPD